MIKQKHYRHFSSLTRSHNWPFKCLDNDDEGSNEDDDHGCGGEWQVAARGSSNDSGGPSDLKVSLTATY